MRIDSMRLDGGAAPSGRARPRIVYVATQVPYPLTSGLAIRQFNLLRAYSEVGDVHLVTFYRAEEELAHLAALRRHCAAIHPVPGGTRYMDATYERLPRWRRRLVYVAGTRALLARLLRSREMRDTIASLAPSADLLHVNRLGMVANVEGLLRARPPHLRLVLDLDDDETLVLARRVRLLSRRGAALACWEQARLRRYQAWALSAFDRVLVCSPLDRDRLRHPRVVVVPNGAAAATPAPAAERADAALLFCGTLSFPPNLDAVAVMVRDIFPRVRARVPDARLLVVGKTPTAEVSALHDGSAIIVAGDVASVEPYYRRAAALVVPLRIAGGTRIKILEAFALGTPVVSTSIGCEGLGVVHREHLLIADDPEAFAACCAEVMRDQDLRRRLIARASALVAERYTWDAIRREWAERVGALLAQRV